MLDYEEVYVCSHCRAHVEKKRIRYISKKSNFFNKKQVCCSCVYTFDLGDYIVTHV